MHSPPALSAPALHPDLPSPSLPTKPNQLELVNLWHSGELQRLFATIIEGDVTVNMATLVACVSVLLAAIAALIMSTTRPVYLLDFSIYKPPDRCDD